MAGDYEYFAAQGHHPLAFALAELVDNALRATKGNTCAAGGGRRARRGMQRPGRSRHARGSSRAGGAAGRVLRSPLRQQRRGSSCLTPRPPRPRHRRRSDRPRSIVVSLVMDDAGSRGLVAVRDNGVGMTPQVRGATGPARDGAGTVAVACGGIAMQQAPPPPPHALAPMHAACPHGPAAPLSRAPGPAPSSPPRPRQELNNWAVMNLSMEDRGLLEGQVQAPAGSRYLSGDIRRAAGVAAAPQGVEGQSGKQAEQQPAGMGLWIGQRSGMLLTRRGWPPASPSSHPLARPAATSASGPRTRPSTSAAPSRSRHGPRAAATCTSCASAVGGQGWGRGARGAVQQLATAESLCQPAPCAAHPSHAPNPLPQAMSWSGASRQARRCTRRTCCTAPRARPRWRRPAAARCRTWRRASGRRRAGWQRRCAPRGLLWILVS
jgi:hypothetical protein